jgi:hypothetical protein
VEIPPNAMHLFRECATLAAALLTNQSYIELTSKPFEFWISYSINWIKEKDGNMYG